MESNELENVPQKSGGETRQTMEIVEDLHGFQSLLAVTHALGAILVILVAIWTISFRGGFAWRSDPDHEFNWHPLLMTIGMIYLFGNGLLMYRTLRNARKRSLKIGHATVLFVALVLTLIGLIAAFDSHNFAKPPKPNLYTLHSWFGLIAVIGFSLQWIAGLVTFLYPGLGGHLRALIMPIHIYFGIVIFILACTAAVLGLAEKAIFTLESSYGTFPKEGILINQIGLFVFAFAFAVLYLVTHLPYKRQPRPEDESLLTGYSE